MAREKISTKTISRIAAIQAIYQCESDNFSSNIDLVIEKMQALYKDGIIMDDFGISKNSNLIKLKLSNSHFMDLLKTCTENLAHIDQVLSNYLLEEWKISDLPILLLSLLRIAIAELLFFNNTPRKVVINEFTDIASDMLSDIEVGFVNSILDNIVKNLALTNKD